MNNNNNSYILVNENGYNYLIISNSYFLIKNINKNDLKEISYKDLNKKVEICDKLSIDIDEKDIEIIKECLKDNLFLCVLSLSGDIEFLKEIT